MEVIGITMRLIMCFLMLSSVIFAELSLYDFSKNSFSSKSFGFANAFTAIAEGEETIISNPAGLAYPGAGYSYNILDLDSTYTSTYQGHFYYNKPFGFSSIQKKDLDGNSLRQTILGLGFLGSNGVSWGVNYKDINGTINGEDIDGWSSDLGLLFHLFPWLKMGVNFKDIYSKDIDLNSSLNLALAGFHGKNSFLWTVESVYENNTKREVIMRYGAQFLLTNSLTLRAGIQKDELYSGATISLGFISFDAGVANNWTNSDQTQYTAGFRLGANKNERFRRRYAKFKKSSYAEFSLGNNINSGKSQFSLLGGFKLGSNDLLTLINIANKDESCEGYIIRVGELSSSLTSLALVEEVREELLKSKKLGKKIFVYFEGNAGLTEYYIASIADMIIMPPLGTISNIGLEFEKQSMVSFLDKLGITSNTFASGEHKGKSSVLSTNWNSLNKYQLQSLIESIFNNALDELKIHRKGLESSISSVSDGQMISAVEAKSLGFVDRLAHWSEVYSMVDEYQEKLEKVSIQEFIPIRNPSIFSYFDKIAIIEVDGPITSGSNNSNFIFGGKSTGANDFDKVVDSVKESNDIKGVILRVNSPGGSVLAADRMYSAIERLKRSNKLVYTSIGSLAASGGYYVASNSDKVYANSSSITGSIGVISSFLSFDILMKELGIQTDSIKTGKYIGLHSPFKQLSKEDRNLIKQYQDNFYQEFVNQVKQDRNLTSNEVYNVAQGQIFSGKQAKGHKLVDEVGGLYTAIEDMQTSLGIQQPNIVFVRNEQDISINSINSSASALLKDKIKSYFNMFNFNQILKN